MLDISQLNSLAEKICVTPVTDAAGACCMCCCAAITSGASGVLCWLCVSLSP